MGLPPLQNKPCGGRYGDIVQSIGNTPLVELQRMSPKPGVRIWAKLESRKLPARLKGLGATNWLNVTLEARAPSTDGFGMNGSAMFIINPPWTLERKLHETLPRLTEILAQGDGANFTLESESA